MSSIRTGIVTGILVALVGCANESAQSTDTAPTVADDTLGARASVDNGGWTATAAAPYMATNGNATAWGSLTASFTVSRSAGPTARPAGVCLLEMTWTPCNTADDCGSAPATLPAGGYRYCTAPDNVGQKYCAYRPGYQQWWCAGTPSTGAPVTPGTYHTLALTVPPNVAYVSYACFAGCTASDPSVSSSAVAYEDPNCYDENFRPILCPPL